MVGWESSNAVKVLEAWQAVDLRNVQLSLDEQAGLVAEHQINFLESRKVLAETTKEFKRHELVTTAGPESPVKTLVPKLLKSYQEEVNGLTNRAKLSEACFLQLYRMVRETPDPCPVISSAVSEITALGERNAELESELEESKRKIVQLRNELEGKSNEGYSSTEMERLVEETVEARMRDKSAEVEEKLFEAKKAAEEEVSALNAELQLAVSDADTLSSRVELLERELEAARQVHQGETSSQVVELQKILEQRDESLKVALEEVSKGKSAISVLESTVQERKQEIQLQLSELSELRNKSVQDVAELKRQLSERPSLEEHQKLRTQLLTMQRALYNVEGISRTEASAKEDDEVALKRSDVDRHTEADQELDTLDTWLLESNRKMKQQVVELKEKLAVQERRNSDLEASVQRLEDSLRDKDALTDQLEGELAAVPVTKQQNTDVTQINDDTGSHNSESPAKDSSGQIMLQAVSAQRDRFRAQVAEQEEKIDELERTVREVQQKSKTLEEDNVQLYQRIRFLQSYKVSERSTLLADQVVGNGEGMEIDMELGETPFAQRGLGRGVEHKYKKVYDSPDNPFQSFQVAEAERMVPKGIERIVVRGLNPFLTRSRGRKFLFFYGILLHVGCMLLLRCH